MSAPPAEVTVDTAEDSDIKINPECFVTPGLLWIFSCKGICAVLVSFQSEVAYMEFEFHCAFDHKDDMAQMYGEYNDLLVETDPEIIDCLAMQDYEHEIEILEVKFAPPRSDLIIAYVGGKAAGCVGIKYFTDDICELKRLYVRPEYRGSGLGQVFCEKMIELARERGYKKLYLDTLPGLESAVRLYRRVGFYEIAKYYDNPVTVAIYMCYDL